MDFSAIGRQFGLDEAQTRAALEALAPVVASGLRRGAQTPEGLQDIFKSVLTGGHQRSLDDEAAIQFDNAKSSGDEILSQVFGNKDVSRGVAQQLSATSGIGAAILKKLLPIVASVVVGQVAKKMGAGSGGGGLGDILGDILGGGRQAQQIPDTQPAPQQRAPQGQGGSLEDILGDILNGNGGKGGVVVKQIPQDQIGEILKEIFGGNVPGGSRAPRQPSPEAVTRGRKTLDDVLGGGTKSGDAADDLLNSVEDAIRRR